MAKDKEPKEGQEPQIIQPVQVKAVKVTKQVEVPFGKALIVPVINGQEDENQAFIIGIKTAERVYANNLKFVIKKKN